MSVPNTPTPTFWADRQAGWVARARHFNAVTASNAVAALNTYISSVTGSQAAQRVAVQQDADGLFAWTPASLSLLREMGADVSVLDSIGRTSATASPVKGETTLPSPPFSPPFPPRGTMMGTTLAPVWWEQRHRPPG